MSALEGPSSITLGCARSERVVITTQPPQAGVVVRPRESNPDVNVRPDKVVTDEHGAAEFEVVCRQCPSKALVTFTASLGYAAWRVAVHCEAGSGAFARSTARVLADAKGRLAFVEGQLDALFEVALGESPAAGSAPKCGEAEG